MRDRHNYDLAGASIEDNGVGVAVQETLLASSIGSWESVGIGLKFVYRDINFRCKSKCRTPTSLGVPTERFIEFGTSFRIKLNHVGHD